MPIHVRVARTPTALEALFLLRELEQRCPRDFDDTQNAPQPLVDPQDSFETTTNIIVLDGDTPIGTMRISEDVGSRWRQGAFDAFCSIRSYLSGKVMSIDRMVLEQQYRGRTGIPISMIKVGLQVAQSRGGDHLLVLAPPFLVPHLEKIGLSPLGPRSENATRGEAIVPVYGALANLKTRFLEWGGAPLHATLGPFLHRAIFAAGETICEEGEIGECAYVVARGSVSVTTRRPDGTEVLLDMLGPGELFGELALLDAGPRMATVRAHAHETDLAVIARNVFEQRFMGDPSRTRAVLRLLARRLRGSSARLVNLTPPSAVPLLVEVILDVAASQQVMTSGLVRGVSPEWLAARVGRPPSLIHELTEVLENKELMAWTPEGLWISDVEALRETCTENASTGRRSSRARPRAARRVRRRSGATTDTTGDLSSN